ncbi:hypothetical protein BKA82DRAFT_1005788 [Pisolithus tinctorius]|uniref:Uncharacterized protein n=1 Tax=Pisolithus tinctorius Marx 270 TaxID=870435 RepID=A0A0C3N9S8_PISTI|nr:hypothetical protein BKA82DRAFT_1005788 [Pisolithus tinctorius]KIN97824.1 hypothetical protein M404DRAFT_1005788 [Pisolithus tinctorius Marx 270]
MISQNDEMGYWRNLVMRRGHQRLDPDYVNNAIRDIYENDLRHSVYDIHQTRQPRTPHSHRTFTPHLPRTHTSYVPQGNDPHLHAHTQIRAQFLRPVVTPVIPFSAIRDPLSHPPLTWTDYPSSGIHFHLLLQPLDHRPPRPYRQQHSSHTPAYHRATESNSARPSHTPQRAMPPPLDEGIRVNPDTWV